MTMKELIAQRVGCMETIESKSSLRCVLFLLLARESAKGNWGTCGKKLTGSVIAKGIGDPRYCYMCSCHYSWLVNFDSEYEQESDSE